MADSSNGVTVSGMDLQTMLNTADWTKIPPPPDFDEATYLRDYPDVAAEIAAGNLSSGFEHYMRWGRAEGRRRPGRS